MPTGYTARLAKKNFDIRSWLVSDIVRALGVCVYLRDDGDLTRKEIRDKLVEQIYKHKNSEKSFNRRRDEIKVLKTRTRKEWFELYTAECAEANLENDKRLAQFKVEKKKHTEALDKLKKLRDRVRSEIGVSAVQYAISQLEDTIEFDYSDKKPYQDRTSANLDEFIREQIADEEESLERSIKSHIEIMTSLNRNLVLYDEFVAEIDKLSVTA